MLGVLYSFRRCPYAMRARLAFAYSLPASSFELREVVLKDKPVEMIEISPKATVPVLQLADSDVIDESLDIMLYALAKNPEVEKALLPAPLESEIMALIQTNDGDFKWALDRYKYSDRYEQSEQYYREKGEHFLSQLNDRLQNHDFIMGSEMTLADLAIFPFIRQFAHVDKKWFEASQYTALIQWLNYWLDSELFKSIMKKYPQWHAGDEPVYFPES